MADTCSASSSRLLCIRWSTVSARTAYLLPLRSNRLLVPWPVHELGTFVSVFQATRGPRGWLSYSDTPTEQVKFIFSLKQNFQMRKGPNPSQNTQDLPSQSAGGEMQAGLHALLFLVPLVCHLPWDSAQVWSAAVWAAATHVSFPPRKRARSVLCIQWHLTRCGLGTNFWGLIPCETQLVCLQKQEEVFQVDPMEAGEGIPERPHPI